MYSFLKIIIRYASMDVYICVLTDPYFSGILYYVFWFMNHIVLYFIS